MVRRKIAVITGSSKGIGRAIAPTFAKSGEYSGIVVNSRGLAEQIKSLGCDSIFLL
jgi:glucose 1-dehydrogenase